MLSRMLIGASALILVELPTEACELRSLKLDEPDKTIFLKQCTFGRVR